MSFLSSIFGNQKRYVGLCSLKKERKIPVYTNIYKKQPTQSYNRGLQYFNTSNFRANQTANVYLSI